MSINMLRPSRTSAQTMTENIFTFHFLILTWPAMWPWPSFAVAPKTGHMHIFHIVENDDRHETNGYPPTFDLLTRVYVYACVCVCVCVAFSQGIGSCTVVHKTTVVRFRSYTWMQEKSAETREWVLKVCMHVCACVWVYVKLQMFDIGAHSLSQPPQAFRKYAAINLLDDVGVQWMFHVAQLLRLAWVERI